MVRKACEGLNTNDIRRSAPDQLDHLTGQEPTLAVLVPQRKEGLCNLAHFFNGDRGIKAPGMLQSLQRRLPDLSNQLDPGFCHQIRRFGRPQEFRLVSAVIQAIVDKVHQVGNHGFRPFPLQQIHQVIVGKGHVLDQNLSDHANSWFLQSLVDG